MLKIYLIEFILLEFFILSIKSRAITNSDSDICDALSENTLTQILGPAFNSRYMSINTPNYESIKDENLKRKVNIPSFYVDDKFSIELSEEPAWEINDYSNVNQRKRRSSDKLYYTQNNRNRYRNEPTTKRPWECEAKIKWIDLGPDYFPRYLRTVECTKHLCWYGHYSCQPRSFTVKLLRRRHGKCASVKNHVRISTSDIPNDLRELWVWEERAVNFCCDCASQK